jgi:SAM-dependent methyltransferase
MSVSLSRGNEFDTGLLGHHCWLELANGDRVELPVERWADGSCEGDELMLAPCSGPTIDIGCGPGRLAAALTERGVISLGIDISRTAVRLSRQRGAIALHRDVFERLPGEARWRHALLADGNIGIGGDPVKLLRRVRELIASDGGAVVELDPPGCGLRHERVRLRSHLGEEPAGGSWFTWAWVGVDVIADIAEQAALRVDWTAHRGHRWFAHLVHA